MKWGVKFCLIVTALTLVRGAQSEPVSQLHPTDYVNDFAHAIDQNTIARIDGRSTRRRTRKLLWLR